MAIPYPKQSIPLILDAVLCPDGVWRVFKTIETFDHSFDFVSHEPWPEEIEKAINEYIVQAAFGVPSPFFTDARGRPTR